MLFLELSLLEPSVRDFIFLHTLLCDGVRYVELDSNKTTANRWLLENFKCSICTQPYTKYGIDPVYQPGCIHTFCRGCITKWRKRNNTCPLCVS